MKKIGLIISALALVLGISQCKKPNMPGINDGNGTQHVVLKASFDNGNSKIDQNGTGLKWTKDTDKIIVIKDEMQIGELTCKNVDGTFEGNITPVEGNIIFKYGAPQTDFTNQSGLLKDAVYLESPETPYNSEGGYVVTMTMPDQAVLKLDLKALGTATPGNTVTITKVVSGETVTVASVKDVTNAADNPYYVAVPADGTEVEYRFIGNGKVFKKKWTVTSNTFYTKTNGSGGSTGEAIVIEGSSLDGPSSVTTTTGCSGSIYVMGGTVTLPSGAAQQVEYGLVYSQSESVPEIGKAGCTTVVGGTESFPVGTTNFSVDITGLTTGVTYYVRAYAIGENGNVVYAPNDATGIKTIVGDTPKAVGWNGGGTPGASPYEFTVNDSPLTKVRFSQGNL